MAKFLFVTFAVIAATFVAVAQAHYCADCKDPNEELILAKFGELTCGDPTPKPCSPVKECRCRSGYVRHAGKCIKPCDCPVICNPFEEFVTATTHEPTCENLNPGSCSPVKECRCIRGYVRHNKKCIRVEDCPVKCNPFEEFVTATTHEPTCENLNPGSCSPVKECRCIRGYVRHNKKCIRVEDCPVKCKDPREEFVLVKTTEPTCKNPIPSPCNAVEECRCKIGYFRHNGKCIKPEECPCGKNEIYSLVAPIDEESCANLGKPCKPGTRPGCMCIKGFVRNCYQQCVKPCDCSKH